MLNKQTVLRRHRLMTHRMLHVKRWTRFNRFTKDRLSDQTQILIWIGLVEKQTIRRTTSGFSLQRR